MIPWTDSRIIPAMDIGLVGLPGSGKTALFNALTGSNVSGFSDKPNVGVANIPDPRLDTIAEYIPPQKLVPATIHLVDVPGVAPGSDAKKLNKFLEHVRQMDGVIHVVRCFDDGNPVDAAGDIEKMATELILADLVVAESAKDKAARHARSGDADARARVALLEKLAAALDEGLPISSIEGLSEAEHHMIRSYGMITAKPMLYVANVGEDEVDGASDAAKAVAEHAASVGSESVAVCAQLEAELAELDAGDRDEMLESLGLTEPAIGPLARAANAVLGLTTFYTAGEKEVRAWNIPVGATAPEAAGAIHSDIQRGFIRAECFHMNDLVEFKSEKAIRDAGKLRSEGKSYVMQDGDVVHFLFNV